MYIDAKDPRLSVVIPVYNVEKYLEECLASVAEQEFPNFEAILVNDGSSDGSVDIARRWCEADERFRLVHQDNNGLGHARNTGAARARGEYLTFLDSDDRTPRGAWREMIASLDRSGSDFATGNVQRFDSNRVWQAGLYRTLRVKRPVTTQVSRFPDLLHDHLAPNKVWRSKFWGDHRIAFPVGVSYEDIPTIVPAHVRARSVDILPIVTLQWRVRDGGDESITQASGHDPVQVHERAQALLSNQAFLAEHADARLQAAYDLLTLRTHLRYHLMSIYPRVDARFQAMIRADAAAYLSAVSDETIRQVPVEDRITYRLLSQGNIAAFDTFLRLRRLGRVRQTGVKKREGTVVLKAVEWKLPGDPDLSIDDLDVAEELAMVSRVSDIRITERHIEIDGWAYVDRLSRRGASLPRLYLSSPGMRINAQVTKREDLRATELARPPTFGAERSAFTARFPLNRLRRLWRWSRRVWTVMVAVENGPVTRRGPIGKALQGVAQLPTVRPLGGSWWLRTYWSKSGELRCAAHDEQAVVVGTDVVDEGVLVKLTSGAALSDTAKVRLRHPRNGDIVTVPVIRDPQDRRAGKFLVRPADLEAVDTGDPALNAAGFAAECSWKVSLRRNAIEKAERLLAADGAVFHHRGGNGPRMRVQRTTTGQLRILSDTARPWLRQADWQDGARLRLHLGHHNGITPQSVVLRAQHRRQEYGFPVMGNGGGCTAILPLAACGGFDGQVPIPSGRWDLLLRTDHGDLSVVIPPQLARRLSGDHYRQRDYELTFQRQRSAQLLVSNDLNASQRGPAQQYLLRNTVYPRLKLGLRNAVLYESYTGRQFSDSPRTIHEELMRRRPDLEHLVVVRDQQARLPDTARAIRMWSTEYYQAMARSRYVVANTHLPSWFQKTPGQVVLQTWHGVGTKRIGHDMQRVSFANSAYLDNLRQEVAGWDYLISPNPFSTPILRRSFGFNGPMLETGVPRNDIFHRPDRDEIAAAVRRRLGVGADQKIVLYAPTWRDNLHSHGTYRLDLRFDLAEAARQLGGDYAVMFRKHSNVADVLPMETARTVIDASDYPDVQELLLVTDILISDYSTLMCDFANTGRPMLFYTYDLENYRNILRGFYFDFEATVPGPLITHEADLVPAIRDADRIRSAHDDRYRAFAELFCPWDDGGAAARVVDAVFGSNGLPMNRARPAYASDLATPEETVRQQR